MAHKMNRLDPENYSEDILKVVEALRLPHGKEPMFQGSSALKVVYPSDYDLAQYVPVQRDLKRDFQAVIRKLMKLRHAYIGDIKSGEIPELKVIPDNTNSRNYNGRRQGFLTKLKQLLDRDFITKKEYSDSVRLLQPDLTELDMFIIKHDIRFEVVRWTPSDILKGFVFYRNHRVDFNSYLFDNNITKIDVVAWVNGIRYSEITMNYKFVGSNGLVVNNKGTDVLNEILGEVPYLFYKGKYLKICKRMFSIETLIANSPQLNREPNKLTQRRLFKLFNGDLNLLNQITGDIGNLIYLVDNVEHIDKFRFEYEIDQMKYRLGVITNLRYLKIQPVVVQMLEQLEGNVVSLRVLEKLESFIRGFIEGEVKKQMKKWKLLPIPRVYLPSDRIDLEGGGEDMLGEGMYPHVEYDTLWQTINHIGLSTDGLQFTPPDTSIAVMRTSPDFYIKNEKGTGSHYYYQVAGEDAQDLEKLRKWLLTIGGSIKGRGGKVNHPVMLLNKVYNGINDMTAVEAITTAVSSVMRTFADELFEDEDLSTLIGEWVKGKIEENDLTDDEQQELMERINEEVNEIEGMGQKRKKADKGRRGKAKTHQKKNAVPPFDEDDDMPPLDINPLAQKYSHDCIACGKSALPQFVVNDKLWGDVKGQMCLKCFEKKIGRKLRFADLDPNALCNLDNPSLRGMILRHTGNKGKKGTKV